MKFSSFYDKKIVQTCADPTHAVAMEANIVMKLSHKLNIDGLQYPGGTPIENNAESVKAEIFSSICCEYVQNEKNFPILRKMLEINPQGTLDLMNLTLVKSEKESVQKLIEILFKLAFVSEKTNFLKVLFVEIPQKSYFILLSACPVLAAG